VRLDANPSSRKSTSRKPKTAAISVTCSLLIADSVWLQFERSHLTRCRTEGLDGEGGDFPNIDHHPVVLYEVFAVYGPLRVYKSDRMIGSPPYIAKNRASVRVGANARHLPEVRWE
jgi:hypothetical protein